MRRLKAVIAVAVAVGAVAAVWGGVASARGMTTQSLHLASGCPEPSTPPVTCCLVHDRGAGMIR